MAVVFISYSHADTAYRDQLQKHLASLRRQNLVEAWHDGQILAGDELDPVISRNLERADVILLLVSSDFINSDYCYSREMTRAFERHATGDARVIPVIVRPCDWQQPPISTVLATPRDGKPIASWSNIDEAFTDVAKQVRTAVETMNARSNERTEIAFSVASTETIVENVNSHTATGSSASTSAASVHFANVVSTKNLTSRIFTEFSDFDRDEFSHSSFEKIARYFQSSLINLVKNNQGIRERFERVDARRFTAMIYRDGKSIAECTIRIDSMGGRSENLSFSYNSNARDGSSNEMLFFENDGYEMYLKPLGTIFINRKREQGRLDAEGAAEYLWELLISPLQP